MAVSIVTQSVSAGRAAFRQVGRLVIVPDVTLKRKRELPAGVRIGEETRVFRLRVLESEYRTVHVQFAVAWRKGPVIGAVVVGDLHDAVLLAKRQLTHLEHPAG
jgi:hypothetical protein